MPKIDLKAARERIGSGYPAPFDEPVRARTKQGLGDAGGLTDFGVNLTRLPPGCWSSQRHWHTAEDEFVFVISGELTLVSDEGEAKLVAGDCAAFPKNVANGHHLINKGRETATYLEIGTRRPAEDVCEYPDIDMRLVRSEGRFTRKDGTSYS
jgi:uncharacterized cupin superfamily protein